MRMPHLSIVAAFLAVVVLAAPLTWAQQAKPAAKAVTPKATKYGALAVDRNQGFVYAWAYDQPSRQVANSFVLAECKKRNGECSIVVEFSGEGCASYHTISERDGTAYGWGTAPTRAGAESRSLQTCNDFTKGKAVCGNHTWSCNSADVAPFKVLREDLVKPKPAKTDCILVFTTGTKSITTGKYGDGASISSPIYRLDKKYCPVKSGPGPTDTAYSVSPGDSANKAFATQGANGLATKYGMAFIEALQQRSAPKGTVWADYVMVRVAEPSEANITHWTKWMLQHDSKPHVCADFLPNAVPKVDLLGKDVCSNWLK